METTPRTEPEDPRVRLAGERTLLAWVRTGLAMMGFGFVVARFGFFMREITAHRAEGPLVNHGYSLWIGTVLVLLGVTVNAVAAWQHVSFLRRVKHGQPHQPPRVSLGVVVSAVLAILGVAMVVYLLVVR